VQFDDDGMLYVDTTSASPEDIQYSEQIKLQKPAPMILKVDPRLGKILWQVQQLGQRCVLSGKYVYSVSADKGGVAMAIGLAEALGAPRPEGSMAFHIYRLDPENGHVMWNFFRSDAPDEEAFQKNWFVLRYGNDVQAWKFLTF
jgi:outer membrane protein assembly factor BamB